MGSKIINQVHRVFEGAHCVVEVHHFVVGCRCSSCCCKLYVFIMLLMVFILFVNEKMNDIIVNVYCVVEVRYVVNCRVSSCC